MEGAECQRLPQGLAGSYFCEREGASDINVLLRTYV
jgi:hypothetical protein